MATKDRGGGFSKRAEALADLRSAALRNRYIERLIADQELRANLLAAYGAARSAAGRMNNSKPASRALFEDRKLQNDLRHAADALRDAAGALREPPPKPRRRGRRMGRVLLLALVAGVLALALSEDLRGKVLDLMFGAEDEFEYSSTTAPAEPAPATAPAS
jgi:ferric-dicitrate binding protein FerR (iron transport regulator)